MTLVSLPMLLWLVVLVAVCWMLPRRYQVHWISLVTLAFMFWYAPTSLIVLLCLVTLCYYLGRRRPGMAIAFCVLCLLFYRWQTSGNPMQSAAFRQGDMQAAQVLILMGFSYYILRAIHYLVEQLKGNLPAHSYLQLCNYFLFLPTLFVGPINRFDDFLRDMRRRRWDADQFSYGLTRVTLGYAKIVFVAYHLINIRMGNWMDSLDPGNQSLLQYLDCWQYALNLYFQFSGFCDVAIGVGALLGFRICENFRYPYLQPNISAFWRSWHMSLTGWARQYVYPTLAAATRSPYLAIFFSMLFIGLWHEFSLRYLAWGLYHGGGILVHRTYQRRYGGNTQFRHPLLARAIYVLNVGVTLHFVVLGFILNKEASLEASWTAVQQLLGV